MLDPVSALSLVLAINDIVTRLYTVGKDLKDGPEELGRLCTELFALQAALNHVAMNMRFASSSQGPFSAAQLGTAQFDIMMATAKTLLEEILQRVQKHGTGLTATLKQRLTWAWSKDDIKDYIVRLERLKTFFTLVTTSDNLELSRQVYQEVHLIKEGQDHESRNRLHSDLRQWLGAYNCQSLHDEALAVTATGRSPFAHLHPSRRPSSGKWFLQDHFFSWSSCREGGFQDAHAAPFLWLRGKSGSGKTTMLASAIEDYARRASASQGPPHAFFYCTFKVLATQDPNVIIASFIAQLCDHRPDLWLDLVEDYRAARSTNTQHPKKLNLDELNHLLVEVGQKMGDVCLFLDAPNESVQSLVILESFGKAIGQHSGLRICVSSTPDLDISTITKHGVECLAVHMEESGMAADIEDYVGSILNEHDVFQELPSQLRGHIKKGIMSRANGSFRWVDCQLRSLALQDTAAEMEEALDLLSDSLEDHYQSILLAIPKKDRVRARKMLFWLTFQLRPMTSRELAEAIILKDDMREAIDQRHRLLPGKIEYFIRICRSLVDHDARKDTVSLAHASVKAYLISANLAQSKGAAEFYLDESSARVLLVQRCLQYLLQPPFRSGYCESASSRKQRYLEWPLFVYCADSWPLYLQVMDDQHQQLEKETRELLLSFHGSRHMPRGGCFGAWLQRYLPTHLPSRGQKWPMSTPLTIAAREGLNTIVKLILDVEGTGDLEIPGGLTQSTPLHSACAFGHIDVVRTLLAAGANVHEVNGRGLSGIYWANRCGHQDIVQLLLESGVDRCTIERGNLILPSRGADRKSRSREQKMAWVMERWERTLRRESSKQGPGVSLDGVFVYPDQPVHVWEAVDTGVPLGELPGAAAPPPADGLDGGEPIPDSSSGDPARLQSASSREGSGP